MRQALFLLVGVISFGLLLFARPTLNQTAERVALAQSSQTSLRFYGTGSGDIDRVKIPLNNPHRSVDVGGDFTIEFWLKASPNTNQSSQCQEGQDDHWIYGNIILDRDVDGVGDHGDYGISLAYGRIAFGVAVGNNRLTICGTTDLRDGQWHHVAVTRQSSNGQMRIFVNGALQKESNGPTGDLSYRDDRTTSKPDSDPYLVIGAEKHDYDSNIYPSFSGWLDELRISNILRYTANFAPPSSPFTTDNNTVALYHFDGAPGACSGQVGDSSGQNNHGECKNGGANQAPKYVADSPFQTVIYTEKIYLPLVRR